MADLQDTTGETVNLALFQKGRLVYVEILEGRHAIRMSGSVGEEVPLHSTALGKAILAALPSDKSETLVGAEPYPAYTARTRTTWKELRYNLEEVAQQGYAEDLEEMDFGAACVGAAITGHDSYPIGGLSVAGLAARFSPASRAKIGKRVAGWCRQISRELAQDPKRVSALN
jgi:IclR family acetate operon transcriptional repressor